MCLDRYLLKSEFFFQLNPKTRQKILFYSAAEFIKKNKYNEKHRFCGFKELLFLMSITFSHFTFFQTYHYH